MTPEPVIGLEVHVQLATATKLFCADSTAFGAPPNTQVCPVCLGLPGALPVTNARAVELAVRTALGLGCTVHGSSGFARKNYFYPDLPKGYQITQHEHPLATGGRLVVDGASVRVRRVHLEEDAGRSTHDRLDGVTAVDLNRAGVPLVEIVTEPDLRSAAAARAFLTRLKQTLLYLRVSDCDMEKGSLRVDANVSLRPPGAAAYGTKTELKNLNSFAHVEHAVAWEIERQAGVLHAGGTVRAETLLWDAGRGTARSMRTKEELDDYRYFAEPDLPPLVVSRAALDRIARALPELPAEREARVREQYALPAYDAAVLCADRDLADYFEAAAAHEAAGKDVANWLMTDVLGWLNRHGATVASYPVAPRALAELLVLVADGRVSRSAGKRVLHGMADTGRSAAELIAEHGLEQVGDHAQLERWVDAVVAAYPQQVARCRAGETRVLGFLMGQLMKESQGRADPRRARLLLERRIAQ